MSRRFSFINHTGDLGIKVYGKDPKDLFEEAGRALFSIITDISKVKNSERINLSLKAENLEFLLVEWLRELLFLFDAKNYLFSFFKIISLGDGFLKAEVGGEIFQEGRHQIKKTIKAVTYHQLEIKKEKSRWKATIIFDV